MSAHFNLQNCNHWWSIETGQFIKNQYWLNWTIVNCDLLYAGSKVQQPEGSVWRRHHGRDDLRKLCGVSLIIIYIKNQWKKGLKESLTINRFSIALWHLTNSRDNCFQPFKAGPWFWGIQEALSHEVFWPKAQVSNDSLNFIKLPSSSSLSWWCSALCCWCWRSKR